MQTSKMPTLSHSAINVSWDKNCRKQTEEAKSYYRRARSLLRPIVDQNGGEVEHFHPGLEYFKIVATPTRHNVLNIIDETGDRRIIWDPNDPRETKEAKELFKEYADKGWRVYLTDSEGKPTRRAFKFDESSEELFVDDKPLALVGKNIKMAPPTYPG